MGRNAQRPPFPFIFPSFNLFLFPLFSPSISPITPQIPPKSPLISSPTLCLAFFPLFPSIVPLLHLQNPLKGAKNPLSDLILRPSPFPLTTSPHVPRRQDQVLKSPTLIAIGASVGVLFLCNIKSPAAIVFTR